MISHARGFSQISFCSIDHGTVVIKYSLQRLKITKLSLGILGMNVMNKDRTHLISSSRAQPAAVGTSLNSTLAPWGEKALQAETMGNNLILVPSG